jgi:hypothetical protein
MRILAWEEEYGHRIGLDDPVGTQEQAGIAAREAQRQVEVAQLLASPGLPQARKVW